MGTFIMMKKMNAEDTIEGMLGIEKWFRENPKRKVCQTDAFKVRRGYVVEDILKRSLLNPKKD